MKKILFSIVALSAILLASNTTKVTETNTTAEAIEATKIAASKVSKLIGEKMDELKEASQPIADDVIQKAGELKEKATPMFESALEKAKELKEHFMDKDSNTTH